MEFLNRHSQCLMLYSPNKKSTHMQCLSYGGEISNLTPTRLAYHQMRPRFKPHHFKVSITLWSEILKTALVKRGHSFAHSFAPQRSARSVVRSATLRFAPLAPLTAALRSLARSLRSARPLAHLLRNAPLAPLAHSAHSFAHSWELRIGSGSIFGPLLIGQIIAFG